MADGSPAERRVEALARHAAPVRGTDAPSPAAIGGAGGPTRAPTGIVGDILTVANPWGSLDVTSVRHGGELVAEVLARHGVRFVFTLSGGHISPILVACEQHKQSDGSPTMRVVDVRHEAVAAFAADAVGRMTGVPGVVAVTAGPGVANTVCAVRNAQMAESPMVILGGAVATLTQGRGSLQDVDQISVMRPLCKFVASVRSVRDIVPTLRRAFQAALSGVPGPVFVELPLDVLHPVTELNAGMGLALRKRAREITTPSLKRALMVPKEFNGGSAGKDGSVERAEAYLGTMRPTQPAFVDPEVLRSMPKSQLEKDGVGKIPPPPPFVVRAYSKFKRATLFTDAWKAADLDPLPVTFPQPAESDVAAAAALLKGAERPVLLFGSQAMLQPARAEELAAALEAFGAPVFLGGMSRGLLGARSRCHVRQNRGAALRQADVVVLCGLVCDFRMDYGRVLDRKSKVVAANRSRDSLSMNTDAFWTPTIAAVADPCAFALELLRAAGGCASAAAGTFLDKLQSGQAAKEQTNARKAAEPAVGRLDKEGQTLVNPLQLCFEMEAAMPDDSVIVADGGDFVATASYIVKPRGPLRWLDPGAFGTLGVGAGFALAAKLVRPSAEVWLVWGDGSCGYSIAEFDTFKRHNIPIIAVVGNDACWTQIEREQVPMWGASTACPLAYCAYDEVAHGYGGEGIRVDDPSQVRGAMERAREVAESGSPVLLNCLIGRTDFREGSISV